MRRVQNKDREVEFFNQAAADGHYDLYTPEFYRLLFNVLEKVGETPCGRWLEAGCGTGAFGSRLVEEFPQLHVIGVDLSPLMISRIPISPRYSAVTADLEDLADFDDSSMDGILAPNVLHHFPDPGRAIQELGRVCKPQGALLLIEPNGSNPILRLSSWLRAGIQAAVGSDFVARHGLASPNEWTHHFDVYLDHFLDNGFALQSVSFAERRLDTLTGMASWHPTQAKRRLANMTTSFLRNPRYSGLEVLALFRRMSE